MGGQTPLARATISRLARSLKPPRSQDRRRRRPCQASRLRQRPSRQSHPRRRTNRRSLPHRQRPNPPHRCPRTLRHKPHPLFLGSRPRRRNPQRVHPRPKPAPTSKRTRTPRRRRRTSQHIPLDRPVKRRPPSFSRRQHRRLESRRQNPPRPPPLPLPRHRPQHAPAVGLAFSGLRSVCSPCLSVGRPLTR